MKLVEDVNDYIKCTLHVKSEIYHGEYRLKINLIFFCYKKSEIRFKVSIRNCYFIVSKITPSW